MDSPIALAQAEAQQALAQAARTLGSGALPAGKSIRFRPDGKGGELASPFPLAAGLDSAALAAAIPASGQLRKAYPSGGWIAFDLSEYWQDQVRLWTCGGAPIPIQTPPVPDFPARITHACWRLDALAGFTDPRIAARLDRGNPAVQVFRAQTLACRGRGGDRRDRRLVNESALLFHHLACWDAQAAARQLVCLAQRYLVRPGEDALTARAIQIAAKSLGI